MIINSKTEMTLRAVVDGKALARVKVSDPLELSRAEAEAIATWARPFSGTCLTDLEVHVSDIRPSNAVTVLSDLNDRLASRIRPMLLEARRHGFGLRVTRELPTDPYTLAIYRRCIDIPQMTITARALQFFLDAMGFLMKADAGGQMSETTVNLEVFADRLTKKYAACMDMGVAHYREYCQRIVEYGRANGATEIVWGPERRGAVAEAIEFEEAIALAPDNLAMIGEGPAADRETIATAA